MNKPISEALPAQSRAGKAKWRRKRFLVNRRYQIKMAFLAVSLVLALVVLLNFSLFSSAVRETEAAMSVAPQFEDYLKAQDRAQFLLILLASLIFVVGVFLVSLLETHKTAGAAVNIGNRMAEIRCGNYKARVKLRRGDHLEELERAFNDMAEALCDQTWEEIAILEQLAGSLEDASGKPVPENVSETVRRLAEARRRSVG